MILRGLEATYYVANVAVLVYMAYMLAASRDAAAFVPVLWEQLKQDFGKVREMLSPKLRKRAI